jgi:protein-S-isoprenylcysteine O-methyltransferase Ste14
MWAWPQNAIYIPWTVWAVTWILAALWANRTIAGAGVARQAPYRFFTISGFMFLLIAFVGRKQPPEDTLFLFQRHWEFPVEVQWAMVGVATFGFLFCWWARIHLGVLWSGRITRKEGHRVVDTGPYRLVRHPIYTGILTAALATMLLKGTTTSFIGFVLLVIGYWMKGKLEERFLREELGPADYDAYRARTPMLVPFSPI